MYICMYNIYICITRPFTFPYDILDAKNLYYDSSDMTSRFDASNVQFVLLNASNVAYCMRVMWHVTCE